MLAKEKKTELWNWDLEDGQFGGLYYAQSICGVLTVTIPESTCSELFIERQAFLSVV
jgi:hypothetical protein